jgi:hypothetical protein
MSTLSDILIAVNSYTDLEAAEPTGTDLTTRTSYANQAVKDAASLFNFPQFTTPYDVYATGATISLPSTFRELEGFPKWVTNGALTDIAVIKPSEVSQTKETRYAYVLGNPSGGYNLILSGISGATVSILHQKYPNGFTTLTSICELPDPEYVKSKVISYVLQSRNDDRFLVAERDAQTRLANMVGREFYVHGGTNVVPVATSFVIGE